MQELWFLHSAHHLILIDINMKFREDSLNGFQVIEQTRFCDSPREITQKVKIQELCSACRLMLTDIYMKFLEDNLNSFQVTERTRFCDRQTKFQGK